MWQPRQTLANNSSPLFSMNLKPVLRGDLDAGGSALSAQAVNDGSKSAADIVMTTAA
jgi:hypothetical protein